MISIPDERGQGLPAKVTFRGCLVGAYLFSVPAFAYSESLGLSLIPQVTGALLVAYAVLDILASRHIKLPLEIGLYGLMGLWAVFTFFGAGGVNEWRTLSIGTLLKVVVATLACAQLIKGENDLFTALRIFAFSVLFVFYQNMNDLRFLSVTDKIPETERFAGTFADPNEAAIFSLTVICASLLLLLRSKDSVISRIPLVLPIGISLVIIYYSGSKKGLIGLGLFVLFFSRLLYLRQRSALSKAMIILASSGLIITAGYFIYASPFFFRIQQLLQGGETGDVNRIYLAQDAMNIWLTNVKTFFAGVGYDNFRFMNDLQSNSHATPLELLACLGLVGFTLFMGFFVLLFRKFARLYRSAPGQEDKTRYFSIIIFLCIYSFFMVAHVLHVSRELLPILGCFAAYGQYQVHLMGRSRTSELGDPVS